MNGEPFEFFKPQPVQLPSKGEEALSKIRKRVENGESDEVDIDSLIEQLGRSVEDA